MCEGERESVHVRVCVCMGRGGGKGEGRWEGRGKVVGWVSESVRVRAHGCKREDGNSSPIHQFSR